MLAVGRVDTTAFSINVCDWLYPSINGFNNFGFASNHCRARIRALWSACATCASVGRQVRVQVSHFCFQYGIVRFTLFAVRTPSQFESISQRDVSRVFFFLRRHAGAISPSLFCLPGSNADVAVSKSTLNLFATSVQTGLFRHIQLNARSCRVTSQLWRC